MNRHEEALLLSSPVTWMVDSFARHHGDAPPSNRGIVPLLAIMRDKPANHEDFVADTNVMLPRHVRGQEHRHAHKKIFVSRVIFNRYNRQVMLAGDSPVSERKG
jgi:hypothetical protein